MKYQDQIIAAACEALNTTPTIRFSDRLSELSSTLRGLETSKVQDKVMHSGDPERANMEKCDKLGGIEYHPNQIDFAHELAKKLK